MNIFSLEHKVALVTGATGYLGSQIARALASAGAHVLVNSRSVDKVNNLVSQLTGMGYSAEPAVFDVTDSAAVQAYFASLAHAKVNIIINNAYAGGAGTIELSTPTSFRSSFDSVVIAAQNMVTYCLPRLRCSVKQDGDASIINIASMYGIVSPNISIYDSPNVANPPFYGLAKAAILQWTKYAACEFGHEGIRVNAISPGPFPSTAVQAEHPDFVSRLTTKVPLERIGNPAELDGPILLLASSASSYMTGSNIVVDGGWTCW